jgi:glycogen debranching enzyme
MSYDPKTIPFSRYGSYLAVSHMVDNAPMGEGIYLRDVHGVSEGMACLKFTPMVDGEPRGFSATGQPDHLRLDVEGAGAIEFAFDGRNGLRVRGQDVDLRVEKAQDGEFDQILPRSPDRRQIQLFDSKTSLMQVSLHGPVEIDAPWEESRCPRIVLDFRADLATRKFEFALEQFVGEWVARDFSRTFEECRQEMADEFDRWMRTIPRAPRSMAGARQLAGYVLWSCVVEPEGILTRPAMLMSKNKMCHVWSWDNCFNAMALALGGRDDLAWEQLMLLLDFQNDLGALPDSVDDLRARWQFVKPPVYGWTLQWLSRHTDAITDERIEQIYPQIVRLTRFWLNCRDDDGDGICQYHHGNDSGWDNGTIFAAGCPVESPDLAAWLVLQMDWLAEAARRLGKQDEAQTWNAQADAMLEKMLDSLWHVDQFVARVPESQWSQPQQTGDTLLLYMPIVLGERLSDETREKMVASLRQSGRFFTKHGYATESPKSPLYQDDGYWRGPIWAPSTMILADGLARSGQEGLAHEIARRFCRMCASAGFAENFDAQSGQGLRDRAYSWTAAVFLILAQLYLVDER